MPAFLASLWDKVQTEPVIVTNLTAALIALVIAFGVPVSPDQKTAIIGLVAVVATLFARSQVTPA